MGKKILSNLAILGGKPAFQHPLYVGRPNIGDRERLMARIGDLLDRRWLSNNGPYVEEFERRVAEMVGVRHCVAMCNATVALEIVIRAVGLKGEVIIPSFTFIATAHALQWQQITPVFCDIDPRTHTLDAAKVERMITPRTTGIIGVHLWGRPCDISGLTSVAVRHDLKLLFDSAHALACSHEGTMIGNFGNAEVFSFHATKFFNTFEGGAVTTNDDDLAARIRLMRNFGFADYDTVVDIGTNGKMNEVSAAMGLTSLDSLAQFVDINRRHYHQYREELADVPGITLLEYNEIERCNYQYIVLEIDEDTTGTSRDQLLSILRAENVIARRYFYPGCHRMEPYASLFPDAYRQLPTTEFLAKRVLTLPTGETMTPAMIATICSIIRLALSNARQITHSLRTAAGPNELS